MCGIVGYATNRPKHYTHSQVALMHQLLYSDVLRGSDATGLIAVQNPDKIRSYKKAIEGRDFLSLKHTQQIFKWADEAMFMIGHNRKATVGATDSDLLAHPFEFDKVIGVHNGTLGYGWRQLPGGQYDSDSEALYAAINEVGIDEAVLDLDGAFALVYYNKEEDTLNFIRNSERPLAIGEVWNNAVGHKTYVYASEKLMLEWLCDRNQYILADVIEPKPGELWTIDRTTFELNKREVKLHSPKKSLPALRGTTNGKRNTIGQGSDAHGTSGKKRRTIAEALEELGYPMGSEIIFTFNHFRKPRNTSKHGKLTGISVCDNKVKVEAFGVDEALIKGLSTQTVKSDVINIHLDVNGDEIIGVKPQLLEVSDKEVDEFKEKKHKVSADTTVPAIEGGMGKSTETKKEKKGKKDSRTLQQLLKEDVPPFNEEELGPFESGPTEVSDYDIFLPGPNKRKVTAAVWKELTKHGCASCTAPLETRFAEFVEWTYNGEPLCPDCSDSYLGLE